MELPHKLLDVFASTFRGHRYRHRDSSLGDFIAVHMYEDLRALNRSAKLRTRIDSREGCVNLQNRRRGIIARRGDGTFGERIPGTEIVTDPNFRVARGQVATVEIGVEVKVLFKAMIKQIDRVIGDLQKQTVQFRRGARHPICVGIVGINHAAQCTSYEGDRPFPTDGRTHRHPIQEAAQAQARLAAQAAPSFDEFLMLHFEAANVEPYDFNWIDYRATMADYGAVLTRVSREFDRRF